MEKYFSVSPAFDIQNDESSNSTKKCVESPQIKKKIGYGTGFAYFNKSTTIVFLIEAYIMYIM